MNDQLTSEKRALREELIQVAAVAVAIIEDIDRGSADLVDTDIVLQQVQWEREAQNEKWGAQSHGANDWLHILMEEVGEAAEEIGGSDPGKLRHVITNVGKGSKRHLTQKFGM